MVPTVPHGAFVERQSDQDHIGAHYQVRQRVPQTRDQLRIVRVPFPISAGWTQQDINTTGPTATAGLASFLPGLSANGGRMSHEAFSASASTYMAGFVQDDWKITLTTSLPRISVYNGAASSKDTDAFLGGSSK